MIKFLKNALLGKVDARAVRIRSAIYTSLLSKGSTLLLQLVALPLIARTLGSNLFGLYAALSALPAMMSNVDMGVGPALSQRLAIGEASGDRYDQAKAFQACAFFIVLLSALVVLVGIVVVKSEKLVHFYVDSFPDQRPAIISSCWVVVVLVSVQLVSSLGQKARAGFQEVHINNLYGAAGNLLLCGSLIVLVNFSVGIPSFILIVYGCAVLAGIANLGNLLARRPYLVRPIGKPDFKIIYSLVGDSFWFAGALSLLTWQREAAKMLLLSIDAQYAANYSILLSLLYATGGFIVMFTGALWPAIADARAQKDQVWLKTLKVRLNKASMIIAALGAASIFLFGLQLINLLYSKQFVISKLEVFALGLYFGLQVLGHIRFTWIMGCGGMRFLFGIAVIEFSLNLLLALLLREHLNPPRMIFVLCISHFIASVVLQTRSKYWKVQEDILINQ